MREAWVTDLGRMAYGEAWDLQKRLVAARQRGAVPDVLLLVEHPPVITLGRRTDPTHLLMPRETLSARGFDVFDVERGGSVTYHGPGQLVGYPILNLRTYDEHVAHYMHTLEETIILTLRDFGIAAMRVAGRPGVWVAGRNWTTTERAGDRAKMAAIGVAVKRKVTMHGFALNVDPDLTHFNIINPCGLGEPVTSMRRWLGRPVGMDEVRHAYIRRFEELFSVTLRPTACAQLQSAVPDGPPTTDLPEVPAAGRSTSFGLRGDPPPDRGRAP